MAAVVFFVVVGQIVISQFVALLEALPLVLRRFAVEVAALPAGPLRDSAGDLLASANELVTRPVGGLVNPSTLSGLAFATLTIFEGIFAGVTVLVIAYFWIAERSGFQRWVLCLFPRERRNAAHAVWETVEFRLGAWSRGQLLLMFVVGLIQGIGYTLLGLPFSLLLGVWAGLAEIIPIIGPYIGAAPALMVALTRGPRDFLLVAGFAVAVNLIEANVLVPRIMAQAVGLSPLIVIVALLVGATAGGIIGALIAVPIAAAIQAGLAAVPEIHRDNC
jgi:predicted PurR-regulated permease PerM